LGNVGKIKGGQLLLEDGSELLSPENAFKSEIGKFCGLLVQLVPQS
jgi:hypothetical protein